MQEKYRKLIDDLVKNEENNLDARLGTFQQIEQQLSSEQLKQMPIPTQRIFWFYYSRSLILTVGRKTNLSTQEKLTHITKAVQIFEYFATLLDKDDQSHYRARHVNLMIAYTLQSQFYVTLKQNKLVLESFKRALSLREEYKNTYSAVDDPNEIEMIKEVDKKIISLKVCICYQTGAMNMQQKNFGQALDCYKLAYEYTLQRNLESAKRSLPLSNLHLMMAKCHARINQDVVEVTNHLVLAVNFAKDKENFENLKILLEDVNTFIADECHGAATQKPEKVSEKVGFVTPVINTLSFGQGGPLSNARSQFQLPPGFPKERKELEEMTPQQLVAYHKQLLAYAEECSNLQMDCT